MKPWAVRFLRILRIWVYFDDINFESVTPPGPTHTLDNSIDTVLFQLLCSDVRGGWFRTSMLGGLHGSIAQLDEQRTYSNGRGKG